jgi:hypothetical protein
VGSDLIKLGSARDSRQRAAHSRLGSTGRRRRAPRGGASSAMADLGRPAFIWDGVKPWRTLVVWVIHPGYQRGGSGLGSLIPTARAARGHWVKWAAHAEGGRGDRNEHGVFLTAPGYRNSNWRPGIEGVGGSRGGAEARSMAAAPIQGRCSGVRSRGKEWERRMRLRRNARERLGLRKGGGRAASACGSRATDPELLAVPLRLDPIQGGELLEGEEGPGTGQGAARGKGPGARRRDHGQ